MLRHMLACLHAGKMFGKTCALEDVSFAAEPGECVCIVAKGGGGKSLLMRLLLGLETPSAGRIEIDGVDVRALPPEVLQLYRAKVGAIFQEARLLPRLTVRENVGYVRGDASKGTAKEIQSMLEETGLAAKADAFPESLSPSEREMACIARALVTKPMIVLADEPLAALDGDQADIALKLLKAAHARGASLLIFSQSASLAHRLGGRVLQIEDGILRDASAAKTQAKHRVAHSEPAPEAPAKEIHHKALKAAPDEEAAVPVRAHPKPAPGAKTHAPGEKRKIKITSVGS
jgi:ABC-type ATPase involved in cell division